ncbi:ABC transporter permease [Fulvivirgaceae bacterium BMA10]|uniref:ABC transporter permease n=1 Tax=Splendidivirga corallicola TaxID=3051826 RepID=A0ABT8KP12_9BACT|nr:ABC transporter permease [Fulvivirgaceae bacterium BMA10]
MEKREAHKTPALANWLAKRFIDRIYLEEFFGDLQEIYTDRLQSKGRFHARFMYWIDMLHLLFGFSSFNLLKTQNNNIMIRSMFKIAWLSAIRQKQFTVLNILGLTLGIATSLIIGLYIHHETTYDSFHTYETRIYRINQSSIWYDWNDQYASTGPNVAVALREDVPEFEEVTRILKIAGQGGQTIRHRSNQKKNKLFIEQRYFAAEENFFNIFSFEFLQGDPKTALKAPSGMVITEETAKRYFGQEEVMGKTLEVKQGDGSWKTFTISGILANVPKRSHLQFDILVSLNSIKERLQEHEWRWVWTAFSTYGLVKEGTDIQTLTEKIQSIPPKWAATTTKRIFNQTFDEFTAGKPWRLYLQPLREIYLSETPDQHYFGPTGSPQFVQIFGAIGVLVLVLSCINFMNLSTARSSNRAKEVGIRKVMGSERKTLIKQFIFESILFVGAGTLCAVLLVQFSLKGFNALAEKQLTLMPYLTDPIFLGIIGSFVLLLGFVSGSYPALYLSSFKPIQVLKGKMSAGFKGKGIRNSLVIFQFTISIALIICSFFVQKQLTYTSSLDLGIDKDNILQIHHIEQLGFDTEIIKTKLAANPAFSQIGKSFAIPPNIWDGERYRASGPESPVVDISNFRAEGDYLNLLGAEFVAGRNFDPERINDKYGVILNEEAVKVLGWGTRETYDTNSPIGKFVIQAFDNEEKMEVIGVVKDFNFNSVKEKIGPLMVIHHQNDLWYNYGRGRSYLSLQLNSEVVKNTSDLQSVLDQVRDEIRQIDPSVPFSYSFMDQEFESTFRSEQRMGTILNLFTAMAVIIACLGLFGLAAFSAEQRMKELGIRKVLGAGTSALLVLFSSEFTRLIFIAILLASPMAYFLVDTWLTNFAYRTPIDLWVFMLAAFSALVIALVAIGYQSLKAACQNPVEILKDE